VHASICPKESIVAHVNYSVIDIQEVLPHRFPFLFVDRIIEHVPGEYAVGVKNVTINEPFFQGHYPGHPVFPGVLMIEALGQVGAFLVLKMPEYAKKLPLFTGVENSKLRKQVVPGDVIILHAKLLGIRKERFGRLEVWASVNDEKVADGELRFAIIDRDS
jgi:3-hydroxyacyl-[acyl-carrier-protein] dehydratase